MQPFQLIITGCLWRRSPTYYLAVGNQVKIREYKLIKRLLADQRLFNLVIMEQEELPQILQRKATNEEPWLVAREMTS